MNEIYWQSMRQNPPARTVLVVGALAGGEKIEINCIAVSSAATRRVIHPQGWPEGPQVDPAGVQADDVLYMSAQAGVDPITGGPAANFAGEVKQALDNVTTIVTAANMSMAHVVWVNPYLSSTGAPEDVMEICASRFVRQTGLGLWRRSLLRVEGELALLLICDDLLAGSSLL